MVTQPGVRAPRWWPLLLWVGCLGLALVALQWLAGEVPAVAAPTSPAAWSTWVASTDPLTAALAVLRLLALALSWYLLGVTTVSLAARLLRATRLVRLADALSVGPVRTVVQHAVGVGLAAGVVVTSVPLAGNPSPPADVVAMVPVDVGPVVVRASAPRGLALADAAAAPVAAPVPAPAPASAPAALTSPSPEPTSSLPPSVTTEPRERTVVPGDHFWAIAAEEVADHLGRTGTEGEVRGYWRRLVEVNADRLVALHNPDLLLPGQRVLLPVVEL